MIDIGPSLLRAQRANTILGKNLLVRCVLTYGSTTYTYTTTKIKQLSYTPQMWSHKANVLIEDTDKTLHGLDLEGYKAVLSFGLITRAGEEWVSRAPMWVIGQQRDSYRGRLECGFELEGIFDRMAKHKATASYTPDSTDTRTVKDWLKEIISLTSSTSESTEEQTTEDDAVSELRETYHTAGQKLTISDRTVTKLSFLLKKVGSPTGDVDFVIRSVFTGEDLARKTWGDAFNLGTTFAWKEVTFDTPIHIDEEVRIYAEYTEWDSGENYVELNYYSTSSIKADEEFTRLQAAGTWVDYSTRDCAYIYTYSATPITVYDDYPAYGLVFDSEDDLIDAFIPADSFRINLNDTRLRKVRELLQHTDCIALPKADGLIHIIDPTTSGTTYDNEYTLVEGRDYHNFFSKRFRRRVVSPNYITFMNHPSHDDSYTGSASDDSADLDEGSGSGSMKEIETHYVRAENDLQCANLATAYLSKLQMVASKGSGVLSFVHFGQEPYDYVNFVDARAGDNRAGNVGFLTILYKPGQFNMHIGFGRVPGGAPLMRLAQEQGEWRLTAENLLPMLYDLADWFEQLEDIVDLNEKEVLATFLDLYEDAYFRKLTVTDELFIPSEA